MSWADEVAAATMAFATGRKHYDAHVLGFSSGAVWEHERTKGIERHLKKILAYCKGGDPCGGTADKPCHIHEHEEARAALALFQSRKADCEMAPTVAQREKKGGGE